MSKQNNQVQKALSGEDMTILANIQTLIDTLKAGGGAEAPAEAPVEPAGPEDETAIMALDGATNGEPVIDPKKKDKEVKLTIVDKAADTNTASDGATASDDAEPRIKDVQTEESLKEQAAVGKGLIEMFSNLVNKGKAGEPVHPVLQAINDLTAVVKQLYSNQSEQANAIKGMMDATGITAQMDRAEKSLIEKTKPQPVVGLQGQQLVDLLSAVINKTQNTNSEPMYSSPSALVNKTLADVNVLSAMVVKK